MINRGYCSARGRHFLSNVGDDPIRGNIDRALIRAKRAKNQLKQGGFTNPVSADYANALAAVNNEINLLKQRP